MIITCEANVAAQTVQNASACWATVALFAANRNIVGSDGAEGAVVAAAAAAVVAGGLPDVACCGLPDVERGEGWEEWLSADDLGSKKWNMKEEGEDEEGGIGRHFISTKVLRIAVDSSRE